MPCRRSLTIDMAGLPPTVRPPTPDQLRAVAERHYMTLTDEEVESFLGAIERTLEVQEWLDGVEPSAPGLRYTDRDPGYRPRGDEDPHNAFVRKCEVRGAADGPLAGYDVGLKDNIAVAGVELTCGSKLLEGYVPSTDAAVVSRILEAGGTVAAKLNMTEFGVSHLSATGAISNPRNEEYHAGSSSAGPAAAVVTGDVDVALGTDGGGSIRVPAAWSGCVGHHPTYGLVPSSGVVGSGAGTLSCVGPLARTVEDCALLLDVIADPPDGEDGDGLSGHLRALENGVEGLTVGLVEEGFDDADDSVDRITRDAIARFEELGVDVVETSVPWHEDAWYVQVALMIEETAARVGDEYVGHFTKGRYDVQLADAFGNARRAGADDLPSRLKFSVLMGGYLADRYRGRYHAKAQNLRHDVAAAYDEALADVDVLAMPTTPKTAERITDEDDRIEQQSLKPVMYSNTKPFNATGHPATSVPCGWSSNDLPVGLMLVGRRFEDATPLRLANAYQTAFGDPAF